jgi:pyruvate dehydrogenase E1 component alpha subunit
MERDTLHRMLRDMLLSRAFEERAAEEYTKGNIVGFLHLYPGEEAVGAGIINAAGPSDYIVSTYREHGHALMRGTPAREVMAELFGRAGGVSGGMGGSMHMFDSKLRFMGGYALVGESCPIALGIAYAVAMRELPEAVICFFGDGAVNQGTFRLVAITVAVCLRKQSLRHWHRDSSSLGGRRGFQARRCLQHPG